MSDLFIWSIAGLGAGIFLFFMGFRWYRQKKLIENTPTSKVRSIAMGMVEIYGSAVPEKKVLKSPFSNKDCVYYRYTIEEYRRSGKHSRWVTIKDAKESIPFYLKDETAAVLVDPKDAAVDIPMDSQFNSGLGRDPPANVISFLKKSNVSFESLFGMNKTMRYREYYIAPNDKLYIMGTAGDNPNVEEATAKTSVEDIMIQKGKKSAFYYISDKPEKEILERFKWKTIGGLFGGSALILAGLFLIFLQLGLL